MTLNVAGN